MKKRRISLTLLLLTLALIFASAAMASDLDASALTDTPDIYLLPPDVPTESTFPDSGEYIPDVIAPTPELNPPEDITPTPELNSPEDMTPILSDWYAVEFWVSEENYLPPAPVTVQNGESVHMPELSPVIAPSGRRFVGWSDDFQAVIPDYRPGEIVTPTRDLFLYAVFAPESCEIIYQIGAEQFRETVLTGNTPQQVPVLPHGFYSWVDESGNFIKPEEIAIWTSRLFVASDIQTVPTVTPTVPPVTPTVTPFGIQPTPTITAPALKSDNHHTAFMSGFNDGLFHPERSLTRAQTVKILYGLIDESAKTQEINQESNPAYFSDVSQDAWYAEPLYALAAMNIIIPDENNAFRGDNPITRAEFAVILSNFIPANYNQDLPSFPDVPSDRPDASAIANTAAAGLFSGNQDGLFMPDGILTRAQAAVVFNRLLGRVPNSDAIRQNAARIFPDVPGSFWAYDQIMEASTSHEGFFDTETGQESWLASNPDPVPLADGFYNINSRLYHVLNGQFLRSVSDSEGYTYDADGRSTTGNAELDEFLYNIITQWTNDGMTRNQKIRALYNYIRDHYTYLARDHVAKGSKNWEPAYALEFFRRGKGNCYSFSSAFYLLVRQLGLEAQTVMGDIGPVNHRPHCWVRIKLDGSWRLFDPELEMSYRRRGITSYNLYNFTYNSAPFQYFVW